MSSFSSAKAPHTGVLDLIWQCLPDYKSLSGYLERRTLLRVGRLHIRLHKLLSADMTPFLHSHPFSYVSVIMRGGYTEETEVGMQHYPRKSVLLRKCTTHHRLESVIPGTMTLFITWERPDRAWKLKQAASRSMTPRWVNYEPGVYVRTLYGRERFCKFDGHWHTAADTIAGAQSSLKPSIDQSTAPNLPKVA